MKMIYSFMCLFIMHLLIFARPFSVNPNKDKDNYRAGPPERLPAQLTSIHPRVWKFVILVTVCHL